MNQTEITILQDAVQWLRRLNGRFWPGKSLDAHAVTRYPNIVAEIKAYGMRLWCPADHAGVSQEIMAAVLEGGEELSHKEMCRLAKLFRCKSAYLASPKLSIINPATNKCRVRKKALEDLMKRAGPLEDGQWKIDRVLSAIEHREPVTYASYRWAISELHDTISRQQHRPRSARRRAAV